MILPRTHYQMLEPIAARLLTGTAKLLTGVQARWSGCAPVPQQRIYFANHTSHLDFILLWSALPANLRRLTRPVAAADYWTSSALRSYLIHRVFRGVLVDRQRKSDNPLAPLLDALAAGDSLIIFPEGTRNLGDELLPFKSGIYHLTESRPDVELIPVWLSNSQRVMPKGALLPVPLLCSVRFGSPQQLTTGEDKKAFLERLRTTLVELGKA
jgi:1-acyl-sn-glycerol-3-phosphate acyltransferase